MAAPAVEPSANTKFMQEFLGCWGTGGLSTANLDANFAKFFHEDVYINFLANSKKATDFYGEFHGREGFRQWIAASEKFVYDQMKIDLLECPDGMMMMRMVAVMVSKATGRATSAPVVSHDECFIRDGKIASIVGYINAKGVADHDSTVD